MNKLLIVLGFAPLSLWAATPAPSAAESMSGPLAQMLLGLLAVVALIFGMAWLLKKMQQQAGNPAGQPIKLLGSRALGPRERLLLVQVGNEQLLLGLTPGQITPLHVLKEPVDDFQEQPAEAESAFAARLLEALGKDPAKPS